MERTHSALLATTLVAAAALRLVALGEAPLEPREAAAAWTAAELAQGEIAPPLAAPLTSALLLSAQGFTFWLAGAGDALARLPGALAGVAAVGLATLFRPLLGGSGALALAALAAVDPWWVAASRSAEGAIFSAACALAATGCLLRARATAGARHERWRRAAGGATGLLAVSGPLAWDLLPPLAFLALALAWPGAVKEPPPRIQHAAPGGGGRSRGRLGVMAAATAATLAATTGLAQWSGPGAVSASLGEWLGSWGSAGAAPAMALIRAAMGWQAPLVALAVAGALALPRRGRAGEVALGDTGWPRGTRLALGFWMGWGFAVLLRDGDGSRWLTLSLPLMLLAAHGVTHWLDPARGRERSRNVATLARATAGIAAAGCLLAGPLALRRNQAGHGPTPRAAASEVRLLASDLEALQRARGDGDAGWQVALVAPGWRDPLLGWATRDLERLRWIAAAAAAPSAAELTVLPSGGAPRSRLLGRYRLLRTDSPTGSSHVDVLLP